jgi:hypothetical protein
MLAASEQCGCFLGARRKGQMPNDVDTTVLPV